MKLDQHPILFQFTDRIQTGTLVLNIKASGRAILTRQYGEWWMYGVNPAIAAPGSTDAEARDSFREAYQETLEAIIGEVGQDKAKIRRAVHQFIKQTCEPDEQAWLQSVDALRSCKATIPEPLNSMPRRESRGNDVAVRVGIKEQAEPAKEPGFVGLGGAIEGRASIEGSLTVVPSEHTAQPVPFSGGYPQPYFSYALPQAA